MQAYDLKMSQGIDIKDTLLEAAAAQLKHEIDGDLIQDVMAQGSFLSLGMVTTITRLMRFLREISMKTLLIQSSRVLHD